eukprot:c10617_g1_i3.p1 GENE.c10617_g1_i3~~c10617_g1_i3.p1  ORF type:complete len:167 (-),score=42.56 c10617_g1_i3:16-483(-)
MIKFLLMVNKLGQTRLCQYYDMYMPIEERSLLEAEIIRKCISRRPEQCAFLEHRDYKVVYRRYASLYLIVGAEGEEENEMALLELIHNVVETLDRYFENVCELDIMMHLEKAHFIVDEMIMNGCVVETNKDNILLPLDTITKSAGTGYFNKFIKD